MLTSTTLNVLGHIFILSSTTLSLLGHIFILTSTTLTVLGHIFILTSTTLSGQTEKMMAVASDGNLNDGNWHTIRIKCETNFQNFDQILILVDENSATFEFSKNSKKISRKFFRLIFEK